MKDWFIVVRALLGVASVVPLLLVALFVVAPFDEAFTYAQWAIGIGWLTTIVFAVYAWRSVAVPIEKRTLWIAVLVFGNLVVLPFFWFWYIRTQGNWRPRVDRVPSA